MLQFETQSTWTLGGDLVSTYTRLGEQSESELESEYRVAIGSHSSFSRALATYCPTCYRQH